MHTQFDCVGKDGITQCDQLGLLSEQKQKCKRCCNNTSTTPILNRKRTTTKQSPPKTPKLLLEALKLQTGKINASSFPTVLGIFIAAAVVVAFVVALQRKFVGHKRKHDALETMNTEQGDTLQGDTEVGVTTDPTQEEGNRLITASPACTIIPLDTLKDN